MSDESFNLSEFVAAAADRVREIAAATNLRELEDRESPHAAYPDVKSGPLQEIAEVYLLLDEFLPIKEFDTQEDFDALSSEDRLGRNLRSHCAQVLVSVTRERDDFGLVLANTSNDLGSPEAPVARNIAKAIGGALSLESRRSNVRGPWIA